MAATQATERTPLIGQHDTTSGTNDPGPLPFILELERDIYSDSDYPAIHRIVERKVDALEGSPSTALTLKLLLCLRYLSGTYFQLGGDNWVDSRSVEQDVVDLAIKCWADLQRLAWSQAALDEALWTVFPLESRKGTQVSLIEAILSDRECSLSSIQLDDRIALSLLRTWRKGRPRSVHDDRESNSLARLESFATPRVLHLIDITTYLVYIGMLLHYLVRPMPSYPADASRTDYRFYCIAVYAVSRILQGKTHYASKGTFVLTLLAFLSALPNMPRPNEGPYFVLTLCFFMHIVQLLLPSLPSASLLFPQSTTFTVAMMLRNLFAVVFGPALTFFIPVIIALYIILVLSLHDIFITAAGIAGFDLFLFTLWCAGVLFTCLTAYMTLSSSSLPPAKFHHPGVPASWDSYGPSVGISLRCQFCRLVIAYSSPYFFPAPFNLISLILIHLPRGVLLVLRDKRLTNRLRAAIEPTVWRVLILPLSFVFGAVWLWR